jgi:hypothetical protein
MDGADEVEDELGGQVEEEEMEERGIHPQATARILFCHKPILRRAHKSLSYNAINYKGMGTTKEVKRLRKIDPRSQPKDALDYMFHTCFQQDFYETVILTRKKHVSEAQWVDQSQMEKHNDPFLTKLCLHVPTITSRSWWDSSLIGTRKS